MPRSALLLPLLLLAACAPPRPELTRNEADALDRLRRDPWMHIERYERLDDGSLLVTTQQGERVQQYQLVQESAAAGGRFTIQPLPRRHNLTAVPADLTIRGSATSPAYIALPLGGAARQP
jgi:hypothetical protein